MSKNDSDVTMQQRGRISPDGWKKRWEEGRHPWQLEHAHDALVAYIDQLRTKGEHVIDVLVPLCGKSVDMKWLYDQGYRAWGVEISEKAIEDFFNEQGIKYKRKPVPSLENSFVYQTDDERLVMFCGDFFEFPKIGRQFDLIWDRAAFVAIDLQDQRRYVETLEKLLSPKGSIVMATMNYDPAQWAGPPHYMTPQMIENSFGAHFTIQHMSTRDITGEDLNKFVTVDWFTESIDVLTWKH